MNTLPEILNLAPPEGAVAYKYADPTEDERWVFDEEEADNLYLDFAQIVWVPSAVSGVAEEIVGDTEWEEKLNQVLSAVYPSVYFEHPGCNEWNRLVRGNGVREVTDRIAYEQFLYLPLEELEEILQEIS